MSLATWIRTRRPAQVYYGWWIVAASSAMNFVASGIFFRGFVVFFVPLKSDLGLSNFQASLVFSMARAEGGLEGPAAGWMIDRFGARKLVMGGILLAAIGYFAFSRVDSFLWFALVYLGVISLGSSVAFQQAPLAGLNMWFMRRRAFVMSLLTASASLGGMVLIPAISFMILKFGWQSTVIIAGFVHLFILLPLALVLRPSPESMGLLPDGDRPQESQPTTANDPSRPVAAPFPGADPRDFSVPEALHTSAYWFLLLGMGLRQLAISGILVNLQPILIWKKASQETVGYLFSLMLAANVVTRIPMGWAADKWPKSIILVMCAVLECAGVSFLLHGSWTGSPWAIVLYLVLAGAGNSAGFVVFASLGEFYGRRRFASLRGIISFSYSWAVVASPLFVGWWADRTQRNDMLSYEMPMWIAIVVLGLAALCFAFIRKPQRRLPGRPGPPRPAQSG